VLDPRDVTVAEGPGASRADKQRFAQAHGKGLID
jgi:hypothetical protein